MIDRVREGVSVTKRGGAADTLYGLSQLTQCVKEAAVRVAVIVKLAS